MTANKCPFGCIWLFLNSLHSEIIDGWRMDDFDHSSKDCRPLITMTGRWRNMESSSVFCDVPITISFELTGFLFLKTVLQ